MGVGAALVLLFVAVRDAKAAIRNWKVRRLQKQEIRIRESFSKGAQALLGGRTTTAIGYFQEVLRVDSGHLPTLLRLGEAHRREKDWNEAIRIHRRARTSDEERLEPLFALTEDYLAADRLEDATGVLREILEKDPTNPVAMRRLRDLYVKRERWEEAHQIQGRIVKENRGPAEYTLFTHIRYEMGRSLYQKGERDKGKRLLKTAMKMDQHFLPAFVMLGDFHLQEGKPEEAVAVWEKGYEQNGNIILLHRLEDLYLQQGAPEKIIWIYRQALYLKPDDIVLRFYLGKLYYRLEMLDEAQAVLSELDGTDLPMPHLHKILGNIHERKEEWVRAAGEFKKALKLRKRVIVPYYCPACDYHTFEWSGRCPRCGEWNTFTASPAFLQPDVVPPFRKRKAFPHREVSYMEGFEGGGP